VAHEQPLPRPRNRYPRPALHLTGQQRGEAALHGPLSTLAGLTSALCVRTERLARVVARRIPAPVLPAFTPAAVATALTAAQRRLPLAAALPVAGRGRSGRRGGRRGGRPLAGGRRGLVRRSAPPPALLAERRAERSLTRGAAARQEVVRYAVYLGMRPVQDRDLLWIAECALTAPVPGARHPRQLATPRLRRGPARRRADGWEEYLDADGDVFYYECSSAKSTYEHPCDAYFKWMYSALRSQSMVSRTAHPLCAPSLPHRRPGAIAQAARRIQRFYRRRLQRLRVERRMVRQTVRAIHLPAYTPPRRLEEV